MITVPELLDKARSVCRLGSDNALAARLNVSRAAVSRWRLGQSAPDEVSCGKLAEMTGEPLARVLGIAGEHRAISRDAKAVWRRLANAATVALLVGGFAAITAPLTASDVCIMRRVSRLARLLLRRLRKPWRISHGSPALLAA
jgi:transcriptional regulator with XRE-family HTH domain